MPVHFADEYTAILVIYPLGDGHKINPGHDAERNEEVAAVMEPERGDPRSVPSHLQRLAKTLGVSETDVLATLEKGELKGKKIGSTWRVTKAALDDFLKS